MRHLLFPLLMTLLLPWPSAAQAGRRAATAPRSAAVNVTVTDGKGGPLPGVRVRVSGPLDREGQTAADGTLRLQGLRSGVYRFRFSREGSITLERDVTMPAAPRTLEQHVMLSPAEPGAAVAGPAAAAAKPTLPSPGKPVTVSLPAYIEQNFVGASQPQRVSTVACSGLTQSVLWQIREPWQGRRHENTDAMLYTVGGEGTVRINDRDVPLEAGTFVSVPRGTVYGVTRRGRNPLIVLATLGGEPCAP